MLVENARNRTRKPPFICLPACLGGSPKDAIPGKYACGRAYPVLRSFPMPMQKKSGFSRRLPDLVTEELVTAFTETDSFEFKVLFEVVYGRLRERNAASGGEEMLRLRAYEKLQNLVSRGVVKKSGKTYTRVEPALRAAVEKLASAAAAASATAK